MTKPEVIKAIKDELKGIAAIYSLVDDEDKDVLKGKHEGLLMALGLVENIEEENK